MFEHNPTGHHTLKKTALAAALAAAMGMSATAPADQVSGTFTGHFTLADASGAPQVNGDSNDPAAIPGVGSQRTPVTGSFTYDLATETGSMEINAFSFFGGGLASATTVSFQDIGDGTGGAGTLIGVQMGFNWNGNFGIPVTDVLDAAGFLNSIVPGATGTISAGCTPCAISTTNDAGLGSPAVIGAVPMAMTDYNTAGTTLGNLFPLTDDGIAGSPMTTAPFPGFHANFDFAEMVIDTYADTTPPVLTRTGAASIDLGVGDTYNEAGATCTDNVDGNLDAAVAIGGDTVNTAAQGSYTITYNCADSSFNDATQVTRTVNVTAAGTPSITLLGTTPVNHEAATAYTDAGASCSDPDDGSITPLNGSFTAPQDFSSLSTVNANVPGAYSITYSCTDSDGNAAPSVVRTVNVVDTTPPAITLAPACSTGAGAISQVADGIDPTPVATAIDSVDGDISGTVVQSGAAVTPSPVFGSSLSRTFNLGFSATDAAGNTALASCDVVLGNPDPVVTLNGDATVILASGAGYNDPLASCEDFVDGVLPDATPDMVIDTTTPNGNYTITYTCTNSAANTGTKTRTVIVGSSFSAAADSGSNFTMINPSGDFVGGATDIFASWDGTLYTTNTPGSQPANLFMNSAQPQPFFGFPWNAHDIRAFGPGSYVIDTSRGNTLNLDVGEDQIGAHMLFNWNNNNDIDVVLVWDINAVFAGASGGGDNGAKGKTFTFATIDSDGDGNSGVPMADGPFKDFNANFNLKLTPQFALPDVSTSIVQGTNDPASVIAPTTPSAVITASVNPDVNGVISYAGPFTYDWSTSDAALLAADDDNTSSATYTFDPSSLSAGAVTARLKVTDGASGLVQTVNIPLRIAAPGTTLASVVDSDGDGIIDSSDGVDNVANPTQQQVVSGGVVTAAEIAKSSGGVLTLGDTALAVGASTGVYQMGISATDIGVVDSDVAGSCIGGCFSFKVSGLTAGDAVDVTLPLSAPIPVDAGFRKFINNQWRDFDTSNGNGIMSAPLAAGGSCAQLAPGAFRTGLTEGDECLKLTIVDGGVNDADGLANGTVVDPSGVSGASTVTTVIPGTVGDPNTGGGCTVGNPASVTRFTEWWLIGGLLGWLGLTRRNSSKTS